MGQKESRNEREKGDVRTKTKRSSDGCLILTKESKRELTKSFQTGHLRRDDVCTL